MKTRFQNSLIKAMIENRDFMPVRDEEGNLRINEYSCILAKDSYGSSTVVEILDGDRFTADEMSSLLLNNMDILNSMESKSNQYFFTIFLFDSEPEKEKQEVLLSSELHDTEKKKYMKCISVDLGGRHIIKHFKSSYVDAGLSKALKSLVEKDALEETDTFDIKELILKKEKEYEFQFKANTPTATYTFIAINIAVYLIYYLYSLKSGINYNNLIYDYGAKVNSKILEGQYVRFITPIFLHGSITHLLVNCYSLYALGISVERIFGRKKFLVIYMIAGILGNAASFAFSSSWAIGASGAIFGLLGALLYFGLEKPALFRRFFGYNILITIVINLGFGLSTTGIDNFAHMGGLVGGFLAIGMISRQEKKRWYFNRFLYIALTIILAASSIAYGFNNDQSKIIFKTKALDKYAKSNDWRNTEETAREILKLKPDNEIRASVLWTLVRAEALSGKYIEAVDYAKLLEQIEPANGHYLLGLLYYDMKKFDLSKQELLEAKKEGAAYEMIDKLLGQMK